jgi:hypothetical protein
MKDKLISSAFLHGLNEKQKEAVLIIAHIAERFV